jgi:hypothetical protein
VLDCRVGLPLLLLLLLPPPPLLLLLLLVSVRRVRLFESDTDPLRLERTTAATCRLLDVDRSADVAKRGAGSGGAPTTSAFIKSDAATGRLCGFSVIARGEFLLILGEPENYIN